MSSKPNEQQRRAPDQLIRGEVKGGLGIPRVSKCPLIMVIAVVAVIIGVFFLSDQMRAATLAKRSQENKVTLKPEPAMSPDILQGAPEAGEVAQTSSPMKEDPLIPVIQPSEEVSNNPRQADPYQQAQFQLWQQQQQEALRRQKAWEEHIEKAKQSDTTVYKDSGNQSHEGDPSMLQGRVANDALKTGNYLENTRTKPLSPYEVKAGTVIPSTLISGINSDLPGQIIAQVSADVYDSATGEYLLIPQGAKLVGVYNHQVVQGQKRVLIAWNRIIYPDSSSLNIEGMAGHDQSGYAGFRDKAYGHGWSVFRNALLLSAITAGAQLSQPRATKGDYSYSSQQVMAASLGMNLNQLGIKTYQTRMNRAPTLTIRPGYQFNVMVNKDIILPVWTANSGNDDLYTVSRD